MQFNYLLQSGGRKLMLMEENKELKLLEKVKKDLTSIISDDVIINAYKLSAFVLIIEAIKHQQDLENENNQRI